MAAPHSLLPPLIAGEAIPSGTVISLDVVDSADEHGVTAILDHIVRTTGLATASTDVDHRLAVGAMAAESEYIAATKALDHLLAAADASGIEMGIFKGVAIAASFYPSPEMRPTIDVDVFIDPHRIDRMGAFAAALGLPEAEATAIDAMVAEGRVFEHAIPTDGATIDLHRDPMNMVLVSRTESDRWDRCVTVPLTGGAKARTLDLEDSIIQALLHLFRDNFADLLHCNDVRLMAARDPDWSEIERRTAEEGWTDIVRYAMWFVSDVFGQPSPLPKDIARWRRWAIEAIWPSDKLLKGGASVVRSDRRQSALSLLTARSMRPTAGAYARRAFPPRSVIDLRSGPSDATYPIALARWRFGQRRVITHRKQEVAP